MTRKVFLVLLALVLTLSVGLVACEEVEQKTHDLTISSIIRFRTLSNPG